MSERLECEECSWQGDATDAGLCPVCGGETQEIDKMYSDDEYDGDLWDDEEVDEESEDEDDAD